MLVVMEPLKGYLRDAPVKKTIYVEMTGNALRIISDSMHSSLGAATS